MTTDTPRTDANVVLKDEVVGAGDAANPIARYTIPRPYVPADLARALERDVAIQHQFILDLHAALGVPWGSDPYAKIKELRDGPSDSTTAIRHALQSLEYISDEANDHADVSYDADGIARIPNRDMRYAEWADQAICELRRIVPKEPK